MKFVVAKILVALFFHIVIGSSKEIGILENKDSHGIGGVVYFEDEENLIIIKQFEYDGKCPETFFMTGVSPLGLNCDRQWNCKKKTEHFDTCNCMFSIPSNEGS